MAVGAPAARTAATILLTAVWLTEEYLGAGFALSARDALKKPVVPR